MNILDAILGKSERKKTRKRRKSAKRKAAPKRRSTAKRARHKSGPKKGQFK